MERRTRTIGGGVGDEDEEAEGVVEDGTVEDGAADEDEGRKEDEERRTTVEAAVGAEEREIERVEDVKDSEEDWAATRAVNRRRGANLMVGRKTILICKKLVLVYLNCLNRNAAAPTCRRIRFIREPAVSGIPSFSSTTVTTVPRRPNRPTRPATCMYASTDRPVTLGPSGMPSEKTCVASGISSPRAIASVVTKSTGSSFSFSSTTGF